jgi:outer membrane protein OmpA-like peptidoglycan-associated protein
MFRAILLALGLSVAVAGCTTDPQTGERSVSNTAIGAGGGAAVGAAAGGIIGGWKGALIGAGLGAVAGGGIGYLPDEQEREYKERLRETEIRVSREQDVVILTMPGSVIFETDSARISPSFQSTLDEVAATMVRYPNSRITVTGHTDSTGSAQYNQQLSQQRAEAVATYLISRGVNPASITAIGAGENLPVASNETQSGRAANRRVEIRIVPTET